MIGQGRFHRVDHHVAVRAAVAAENLVGEQLGARSDTDNLAVRRVSTPVGGCDARDVCAVCGIGGAGAENFRAVGIVRIAGKRVRVRVGNGLEGRAGLGRVVRVTDEVESTAHLAARTETAAELGQCVVETAVHDRDRHAGTVETELVLRDIRAGEADRVLQIDVGAVPVLRDEMGQ